MVPKKRGILRICLEGNLVELQTILQSNPELVKASFINGNTLLHYAGNQAVGELLIRLGAELNRTNDFKETPLMTAVWDERVDVVAFLLEQGADVHHQDRDGNSALHIAAALGNEKLVQLLLGAGADVELQNEDEITPLIDAVKNNQPSVVSLLLKQGANPHIAPFDEEPPLHIAIDLDNLEMVKLLLKGGADPNFCSFRNEKSALHIAASTNNIELVSLLLEHGASPLLKSRHGQLPQHVTKSEKIFQFLLAKASQLTKQEPLSPSFHEKITENSVLAIKPVIGSVYRLHPYYDEVLAPFSEGVLGKMVYHPKPKVSQSIALGQYKFYSLSISHDGSKLAIVAPQIWGVQIRNYKDFSLIETLQLPKEIKMPIYCVDFSPNGDYLAVDQYIYHFSSKTWEAANIPLDKSFQPSLCRWSPDSKHIFYSSYHSDHLGLISYDWQQASFCKPEVKYDYGDYTCIVDLSFSDDGQAVAFFESSIYTTFTNQKPEVGFVGLYLPEQNKIAWRVKLDQDVTGMSLPLKEQGFPDGYAGKVCIVDDTVIATIPHGSLLFFDRNSGELRKKQQLNSQTILALGQILNTRELRIATDSEMITMQLPHP
ncbi:ankyrin repeat domain-containing protein [Thermoflavimicrobium daqui]|uniref:Uncharacterized protein n=1 Tax=Thermoflavimicrobium daqui TaxID=2137476 RepID=A0A364K7M1_9BACL|nr:ankyrin repeat domain-containing protein [Thermoflavimicrobium daqui]RAL26222.1 hypothetical protein DL897_04280 [Thermoflavimicrobium daqui]